jgi:hypothetical protein
MIKLHSQPKKSERGEAVLLTVALVGFAILATTAALLMSSSLSQANSRVTTAKIDIDLREDVLVRAILQQSAQGMLPNSGGSYASWNSILTAAVNQVNAVSYADPTELGTVFPSGTPTMSTLGDTGQTTLAVFQGYQGKETPFGGTKGLDNFDPGYDATTEPPWYGWPSTNYWDSTTAINNPFPFFTGSQYNGTSSTVLTSFNPAYRWQQMTFPNIRLSYKKPGETFVARRVWWKIPICFQTTQQMAGVNVPKGTPRFPAVTHNYILSVYEVPSQLPITGNVPIEVGRNPDGTLWGNTSSGAVQINGPIFGDQIQLYGGTYADTLSARRQLNVVNSSTVLGEVFADNTYQNFGQRELHDANRTATYATSSGSAPVSAPLSDASDTGKTIVIPILPGDDFLKPAPGGVPANWDLYARPYYKSQMRILISQWNSTANNGNGIYDFTVYLAPDSSNASSAVLPLNVMFGIPDSNPQVRALRFTQGVTGITDNLSQASGLLAQLPGFPGQNVARFDFSKLATFLSNQLSTQASPNTLVHAIYIGVNPSSSYASTLASLPLCVANAGDLSAFTYGLSIITPLTLTFLDNFNTVALSSPYDSSDPYPPVSVYAQQILYGYTTQSAQVNFNGRIDVDTPGNVSNGTINPLSFRSGGSGSIVGSATSTYNLKQINNVNMVPPITRVTWILTMDKIRSF